MSELIFYITIIYHSQEICQDKHFFGLTHSIQEEKGGESNIW